MLILKVFCFPLLLILSLAALLGRVAANLFGLAVTLLLLVVGGSILYCVVQGQWTSLMLLAGMGLVAYLALFAAVFGVCTLERLRDGLWGFLRS